MRGGFSSVRCGPPRPAAPRQQCAIASGLVRTRARVYFTIFAFFSICVFLWCSQNDEELLISLVQGYKELYDLQDSHYDDQQRRDNIWKEIGDIMKEPGK